MNWNVGWLKPPSFAIAPRLESCFLFKCGHATTTWHGDTRENGPSRITRNCVRKIFWTLGSAADSGIWRPKLAAIKLLDGLGRSLLNVVLACSRP